MSSHREAPEISKDPVADSADLYAFVSPDNPSTVTIIANYVPLQQPAGGPNFYEFGEDVLYEIHIDNDGDAIADVTYQFRFKTVLSDTGAHDLFLYNTGQIKHLSDPTWNRKQFYSVTRVDKHGTHLLAKDLACPPCNVGTNSIPSYAPLTSQAIHEIASGTYSFAGQRADGFYVDLGSIFDLGDLRPFQPDFLLKASAVAGINTLAGLNVHSIAIQVPIRDLTKNANTPSSYTSADAVMGVWTTAARQKTLIHGYGESTSAGPWIQVSRLGNPLINEVIIPMGVKDYWNTQGPDGDHQFAAYYDHPTLAALLNVLYPGAFPNLVAYTTVSTNTRPDLDAVLLTGVPAGLFPGFQNYTGSTKSDLLRLNVAIKPVTPDKAHILGVVGGDVAGFPNGRRVYDDVVSIELKAVAGALLGAVVKSYNPDGAAGLLYDVGGPSSEPATAASLSAFGLSYRDSFPYLTDPWDGFDNPSRQNVPLAG
ncbi:MAG: DUF4331 domain-containing protein [Acidimicrobiales bacterium]|jgi:hypothetical protein